MRITMERTMGETYLLLEDEEAGEEKQELETQMLTENRIDGLLRLQVRSVNGVRGYRYCVSGMASVKQLFEKTEMDAACLRNLIRGIRKAFLSAEEFLLNTEHILTDPAYIFQDLTSGEVCLCICPLWKEPLQEGLKQLAEYLISVTDHGIDEAIDLSYGFYKLAFAGDFRFDRLLEKEESKKMQTAELPDPKERAGMAADRPGEMHKEKGTPNGALTVLGFAAVFALIVCFTMCLLLLKFR